MNTNIDFYLLLLFLIVIIGFLILFNINSKLRYPNPAEEEPIPEDLVIQLFVNMLNYDAASLETKVEIEQELRKHFANGCVEQKELVNCFVCLIKSHPDVNWNILKENIDMSLMLNRSMQSENDCFGNVAICIRIMIDVLCDLRAELKK